MKTSMNIRLDKDIKQQAQCLFSNLGLDMSTAINLFLRQAIQRQGIPFDINLHRPNPVTMKAIEESNKNPDHTFSSVKDLMSSLDD